MLLVYGGGAWELALARRLETLATQDQDRSFCIAAMALQKVYTHKRANHSMPAASHHCLIITCYIYTTQGLLAIPEALLASSRHGHIKANLVRVSTMHECRQTIIIIISTLLMYT